MIRGTTAKFEFQLPYPFKTLTLGRAKFTQQGNNNTELAIIKQLSACRCSKCGHIYNDCNCSDSMAMYVTLDQGETLRFSDKYKAMVQFRAKLIDGTVFASREQWINVYPLCEDCPIDETQDPDVDNGTIILDGGVI